MFAIRLLPNILHLRGFAALLSLAALAALSPPPLFAQSSPRPETHMPADIDPQSGFRLPLLKREELDEAINLLKSSCQAIEDQLSQTRPDLLAEAERPAAPPATHRVGARHPEHVR